MLAAVTYGGAAAGQTDNVQVTVKDASNAVAAQTVAVTTDTVPFTTLIINRLSALFLIPGATTSIPDVALNDPVCASDR